MAGKHYIIATQNGYLVDSVTGYPYEFRSKAAAVKALAAEVKDAVQACRRSHKTCSVVGSARTGNVQIKVGGRQGYHLWQRYLINERPGARKPPRAREVEPSAHAIKKQADAPVTYLTTPIVEVRNDPPPRGSGMTREGYTKLSGAPTATMIRLQGEKRWRRLMVWQFSNMGTLFVKIDGKPHVVREEMLPREGSQSHATKKGAAGKMGKTMHEFKHGTLRSGSGGKVKSRKQAIAIGLSQERRAGHDVPPKSSSHATMGLDARVRAYLSNMRPGAEIDAYGLARALREDPSGVAYALQRAAKGGHAVTEDDKWFGPASGKSTITHSKMLHSPVVLTERVALPSGSGAIHIHHGKGGYSGVLVLSNGNELPMSLGVPAPQTATDAMRGAKKFLAQVYGRSN